MSRSTREFVSEYLEQEVSKKVEKHRKNDMIDMKVLRSDRKITGFEPIKFQDF